MIKDQRSKIILNLLFQRSLFAQKTAIFRGHGYAIKSVLITLKSTLNRKLSCECDSTLTNSTREGLGFNLLIRVDDKIVLTEKKEGGDLF